jgi:hypothetical protein
MTDKKPEITWRWALGTVFFSGGSIALVVLLLEHYLHYELGYLTGVSALIAITGITIIFWPTLKKSFAKKQGAPK